MPPRPIPEQMNKNLDSTWAELVRQHPDLAQLPDPDRRPPNEESLDGLIERGEQFDGNLQDWWAQAKPDNPLDRFIETIGREPNKTIFVLFLRGFSEREIVSMLEWQNTYRSCQSVHGVIARLKRKFIKNNNVFAIH